MRILVAETGLGAGHALRGVLRQGGATVVALDDIADVASFARREAFDAIVLVLPAHGTALRAEAGAPVRDIRRAGVDAPLIAVGAGDRLDPVAVLRAGADDVLNMPFDPAELAARCSALVRRSRGFSSHELVVGPLALDPDAREARLNGWRIPLTAKEFAVLELLVLRRGTVVRKGMFLSFLYPLDAEEPDAKIIDVSVCKLRRKLAALGGAGMIATVWGIGYRLDAPGEGAAAVPGEALRLAS